MSSAAVATSKRLRPGLFPLFAALFVFTGWTDHSLTPVGVQEGYLADAGGSRPSNVALAHAAGEFRVAAANILWLKVVDHYHHQYMASGGSWARNQDILPLLNVIIALDPHFTQAYDVGSLILCELKRYKDAKSFLDQGIANNPTTWELVYDESMMYGWYLKQPAPALPYAEKAEQVATDPFDKRRISWLVRTLKRDIRDDKLAKMKLEKHPQPLAAKSKLQVATQVPHIA